MRDDQGGSILAYFLGAGCLYHVTDARTYIPWNLSVVPWKDLERCDQ